MRSICLSLLLLASPAFSDESMTVTGSRIPTTKFGPMAGTGSPLGPDHGCAEPGCGSDPDDTGFGGSITQTQKNTNNKEAKEKAKKNKQKLANNMTSDWAMFQKIMDWIDGLSIDAGASGYFEVTYGDTKVKGGGCAQYHAKVNQDGETKDLCVERKMDTQVVKKVNGTYEVQLDLTYRIYDTCYWERKCELEEITFIAGSKDELKGFLNDTIGYKYY